MFLSNDDTKKVLKVGEPSIKSGQYTFQSFLSGQTNATGLAYKPDVLQHSDFLENDVLSKMREFGTGDSPRVSCYFMYIFSSCFSQTKNKIFVGLDKNYLSSYITQANLKKIHDNLLNGSAVMCDTFLKLQKSMDDDTGNLLDVLKFLPLLPKMRTNNYLFKFLFGGSLRNNNMSNKTVELIRHKDVNNVLITVGVAHVNPITDILIKNYSAKLVANTGDYEENTSGSTEDNTKLNSPELR